MEGRAVPRARDPPSSRWNVAGALVGRTATCSPERPARSTISGKAGTRPTSAPVADRPRHCAPARPAPSSPSASRSRSPAATLGTGRCGRRSTMSVNITVSTPRPSVRGEELVRAVVADHARVGAGPPRHHGRRNRRGRMKRFSSRSITSSEPSAAADSPQLRVRAGFPLRPRVGVRRAEPGHT